MSKFYLDMEFTNENLYLVDLIEITLIAGDNGTTFHSYVKILYSIPKRVKQLIGITNRTIKQLGLPLLK